MRTILAALDNSLAARPVLETARWMAGPLDAVVDAVHVREDGTVTADAAALACGVTLRLLDGPTCDALTTALADPEVLVAVVGARGGRGGPRPAGHTATELLLRADKPVVVVPPDLALDGRMPERVLVPLDGSPRTARALEPVVALLSDMGVEVELLHVFDRDTVPRFWDRPGHAAAVWGEELGVRSFPSVAGAVCLRAGAPGESVLDVAGQDEAGLIALCWSQDLSPGRAEVVREVMAGARVPVILVPVPVAPESTAD